MKIVEKNIIKQPVQLMRLPGGGTTEESVPDELQGQPVLTDAQVIELAGYAKEIERHYGCYGHGIRFGHEYQPAMDRSARPETVWSQRNKHKDAADDEDVVDEADAKVIVRGLPASPGLASGVVHVIDNPKGA